MALPADVAVGQRITAAYWNAAIDHWDGSARTYTPALTATTTSPTLGTASAVTGRYQQVGLMLHVNIRILFGTSGAAAGSGTYEISLPVTCNSSSGVNVVGHGFIKVAGVWTPVQAIDITSTKVRMQYTSAAVNGTITSVTHAAPGAWTNNDEIRLNLLCEAA
jgi:hypothetical protein